jgi:hypothetical protein
VPWHAPATAAAAPVVSICKPHQHCLMHLTQPVPAPAAVLSADLVVANWQRLHPLMQHVLLCWLLHLLSFLQLLHLHMLLLCVSPSIQIPAAHHMIPKYTTRLGCLLLQLLLLLRPLRLLLAAAPTDVCPSAGVCNCACCCFPSTCSWSV